jgi:hypothetical protein
MGLCIGTYPKEIVQILMSFANHNKSRNCRIKLRGRGHRFGIYGQDLPLDKAENIAIYVEKR